MRRCYALLQVRDVKAAQDRVEEASRENIEALKIKHQREKAQEMTVSVYIDVKHIITHNNHLV